MQPQPVERASDETLLEKLLECDAAQLDWDEDTTLDGVRTFTEPDCEEREVQYRIERDHLRQLQLCQEEFEELQMVYQRHMKRPFRRLKCFPEPMLGAGIRSTSECVATTEEDCDEGCRRVGGRSPPNRYAVPPQPGGAVATTVHHDVVESLVGTSPRTFEKNRMQQANERRSSGGNSALSSPPAAVSKFVRRFRRAKQRAAGMSE